MYYIITTFVTQLKKNMHMRIYVFTELNRLRTTYLDRSLRCVNRKT